MNANLLRKLLSSIAILTAAYAAILWVIHQELTRKLDKKTVLHLAPSLLLIIVGIAIHEVMRNPDIIFKNALIIKSGFGKKILSQTYFPLIGKTILSLCILGAQISIIDKLMYVLNRHRMPLVLSITALTFLSAIAWSSLYAIIIADQSQITKNTTTIKLINSYGIISLSSIIGLLILAIIIKNVRKRR